MKRRSPELPDVLNAGQSLATRSESTQSKQQAVARQGTCDVLVLDAGLRQSLVTVRSLGRQRLHVAALEAADVPTFSSRWCERVFYAPPYEQTPQAYLASLHQALDQSGARVVIASTDGVVELLHRHREEFARRVHIALAREEAFEVAINKEQTLAVARRSGITVPKGVKVESASEVPAALREVGLPAVIKPVESWVWGEKKGVRLICKLATTPDEARAAVEGLASFGCSSIIQQYLSGRREAVSLLYAHGEIYARFAQWARRTQPPLGGTSVLRQSIAVPPDIGEQAERLVRELDLEGYSEVEFRRDDAGTPYLMEINPRLSASVEIAVRAGVNFPYLLYQWANGDAIDHAKSYRAGGWMRYLGGDIITTVEALLQHGRPGVPPPARVIFDFCAACFLPAGYDYFDWQDPLPAWVAASNFARSLPRRLRTLSKRKL